MELYNPIPGIEIHNKQGNPTVTSPNSPFEISFFQTRDSLMDVETYRLFISDCVRRFRTSNFYKHYKGFLLEYIDTCQVQSNITVDMATIEMHHAIVPLRDLTLIIIEHLLNTTGYVCSYDVVQILKAEHKAHRIPVVMLSLTAHQIEENDPEFFIPCSMIITKKWPEFFEAYRLGITQDIAFKIFYYLKRNIENEDQLVDNNILELRDKLYDWSGMNGSTRDLSIG